MSAELTFIVFLFDYFALPVMLKADALFAAIFKKYFPVSSLAKDMSLFEVEA